MTETCDYYLTGTISTTKYGLQKILDLYQYCCNFSDRVVLIGFQKLVFMDANMSAVLRAVYRKLEKEKRVKLVADLEGVEEKFKIFSNNGLFIDSNGPENPTGTAVMLREFYPNDRQRYVNYIENDLFEHEGLRLKEEAKESIIDSLIEVYGNYEFHSYSQYPMFLCGQYYPENHKLKFTMVDLGVGFLHTVQKKNLTIRTYSEAIDWAMIDGNTSRLDISEPGGTGLTVLKNTMLDNNCAFEIISGDAYGYGSTRNGMKFDNCIRNNQGTVINLLFSNV